MKAPRGPLAGGFSVEKKFAIPNLPGRVFGRKEIADLGRKEIAGRVRQKSAGPSCDLPGRVRQKSAGGAGAVIRPGRYQTHIAQRKLCNRACLLQMQQ